ncbi:MAG TPA: hypothetical protein VFV67_34720 [Actinophytocola sp.]|uniref:hypothetical protein n=1 Tax=Actinophytocola sp. TaxID=1872138 RepID=UPI002DBAC6AC|nr:hypothetical protein [Actinophytocola sp.]HEU5475819.1 hypothetical protein [Actinophytocola sp.]
MSRQEAFMRLLGAIRDHLAVAEPGGEIFSVQAAINSLDGEVVTVQLWSQELPALAAALLGWADTLTAVSVILWRVPDGLAVHLDVVGRMVDEAVRVFGGVPYEAEVFGADLHPGQRREIPLGVLRGWAE